MIKSFSVPNLQFIRHFFKATPLLAIYENTIQDSMFFFRFCLIQFYYSFLPYFCWWKMFWDLDLYIQFVNIVHTMVLYAYFWNFGRSLIWIWLLLYIFTVSRSQSLVATGPSWSWSLALKSFSEIEWKVAQRPKHAAGKSNETMSKQRNFWRH